MELPDPSLPLADFEGMAQAIAAEPKREGTDLIVSRRPGVSKAIARRIKWLREQS